MRRLRLYYFVIGVLYLLPIYVCADTEDERELAQVYGDESMVSIATGSQLPISRAPAVATVIMAQDIEAMGATDLDQVLESVPGLHVSRFSRFLDPVYSFRGISTQYNPQVLMLVNGNAITNVFLGNRGYVWGGMPVKNIARIEVIRGPGSALYGADAFSGVINIITKTADDIKGTEFGIGAGSFNTQNAWIEHGGKWGTLDTAVFLNIGKSDGQHSVIQQDASLNSGMLSASHRGIDLNAEVSYEKRWKFNLAYQSREVGNGTGVNDTLDPASRTDASKFYLNGAYQNVNWAPNWELSSSVGYYDVREDESNPPDILISPGLLAAFPNGVIGTPGHEERHAHINLTTGYTGFHHHKIRLGTGIQREDLYETSEAKNFLIVNDPTLGLTFQPLGSVVHVEDDSSIIYMHPHSRNIVYAYVQDEWNLSNDWTLTMGARQDHYSDFGNTTNPRVALVWNAAYDLVVKALYGQAFRAPSFSELYNINNPVINGNPSVRPETISTSELVFSWQLLDRLQTSFSLFEYHMYDIINYVPSSNVSQGSIAENTGSQTGKGFEFEASWQATRDLKLTGSLSVQHSIDDATGQDAGLAPHRRIYVRSDWHMLPGWQLGTTLDYVADRRRQPGDTRPPVADYTLVDLSIKHENVIGDWSISASVFNLFNRDAKEPTLVTQSQSIPYDLPLPGRTFYIELQHKL